MGRTVQVHEKPPEVLRAKVREFNWPYCDEAETVVRMVTILKEAGRPLAASEVASRAMKRWGEGYRESTLYAAKGAGAIKEDMYGVLSLRLDPLDETRFRDHWMYEAMEKAVGLGVFRYADSGIEPTGGGDRGALTDRELAGAEAVMRGVNAYGPPPGLVEWLKANAQPGFTWTEATVDVKGATMQVRAAKAELEAEGRL